MSRSSLSVVQFNFLEPPTSPKTRNSFASADPKIVISRALLLPDPAVNILGLLPILTDSSKELCLTYREMIF